MTHTFGYQAFYNDFHSTIDMFATLIADAMARGTSPEVVAPERYDYRVRLEPGHMVIGADVLIAPGLPLTFEARLDNDASDEMPTLADAAARWAQAAFERRDELRWSIGQVRARAEELAAEAREGGIEVGIADVRLQPAFLGRTDPRIELELIVDEISQILRPFRTTHQITGQQDVHDVFAELASAPQLLRNQRRSEARAIGAIGFVDAVTLRAIDATSEGRAILLREAARDFETKRSVPIQDPGEGPLALKWVDGVLFGYFHLEDCFDYEWGQMHLGNGIRATEVVGRKATDIVQHPLLGDAVIGEVIAGLPDRVSIVDRLLPFDANGNILG